VPPAEGFAGRIGARGVCRTANRIFGIVGIEWGGFSPHFDDQIALVQAFLDHRPAGVEPEAQAAIADVAAADPEQAGMDGRMSQQEIIVFGHEDEAMLFDMVGDDGGGRLAT